MTGRTDEPDGDRAPPAERPGADGAGPGPARPPGTDKAEPEKAKAEIDVGDVADDLADFA